MKKYILAITLLVSSVSANAGTVTQIKCIDGYKFAVIINKYKMNSHQIYNVDGAPKVCGNRQIMMRAVLAQLEAVRKAQFDVINAYRQKYEKLVEVAKTRKARNDALKEFNDAQVRVSAEIKILNDKIEKFGDQISD